MAIGRVKDIPFSVGTRPSIGFGSGTGLIFGLLRSYNSRLPNLVIRLQSAVQIGLIDRLDLHIGIRLVFHANRIHPVTPKLTAHHLHKFLRIPEVK